jgi:site-specific recombinase XerD
MALAKLPEVPAFSHPETGDSLTRSYAEKNRILCSAFANYVSVRGLSALTVKTYTETVTRFLELLGSTSVLEADRDVIRKYLGNLLSRGKSANTVTKETFALRSFFKFLQLSGLIKHNPTLALSQRKRPRRLPRVLTITEVERLIAAAQNPVEAAVVEFLYATGVRVSELIAIRLENIVFAQGDVTLGVAHVKKGKGGKDRTVLFGSAADGALRKMIESRPPVTTGFLFEAPAYAGSISKKHECHNGGKTRIYRKPHRRVGKLCPDGKTTWTYWIGSYYDSKRVQCHVRLGTLFDFPTRADARHAFDLVLAVTPDYRPRPARPYTDRAIRAMVNRMGARAGVGRVYPHALRRACFTHLLESGADLRVIQELAGHEALTTTCLYTSLSAKNLKEIHTRCHPAAEGNEHEEK